MQAYYPSNEDPFTEKMDLKLSPLSSPLGNSTELDPWTLYELEKETQKLSVDPRSHQSKVGFEKKSIAPVERCSLNKKAEGSKQQQKQVAQPRKSNRGRRSARTPPQHSFSNEGIQQMLQVAKSKRMSLLKEVSSRTLYEGEQTPQPLPPSPRLEDSISSLADLDENATTVFGDDEDDDDNHRSCYF